MLAHLLTDGPAPAEYIEHVLMDRYKWTLAEARSVPLAEGLRLITIMAAEQRALEARRKQ